MALNQLTKDEKQHKLVKVEKDVAICCFANTEQS